MAELQRDGDCVTSRDMQIQAHTWDHEGHWHGARFYNAITIGPNDGVSTLNGCVVKDWKTENEKNKQSTNKP